MKRLILLLAAITLVMGSTPAKAVGLIVVDEAHWQPHPPPPEVVPPDWPHHPRPPHHPFPPVMTRPHVFAPLELKLCKADVQIDGQVAVTELEQEFYNPNPQRIEGTFLFPVPKGAHLDKFAMEIDGKQVEAELLDSAKARKMYEDIVRRAKDPALLEYDGQDVFKVRLFPINGHATKQVTVRYTQLLKMDSGLVGFVLPLNTAKYSSTPIETLSVKIELKAGHPIKTLYSPTHTVEINHDGSRHATVGYEASALKPDTDLALYFSTDRNEVGMNLMTFRNNDEDGYFLLLASPGVDVEDEQVVPKDVAFVLDTSGSMSGKKLEQAKKALQFCVENLNDQDRFEVIRFSTEAECLFNRFAEADPANRKQAEEFVEKLKAMGGTAIHDALGRALSLEHEDSDRPLVVIFLTDGLPTVGVTSEEAILDHVKARNDGKFRVFCFGIGTDVNTHLLDKVAEYTRATSQYVLPDEDLEIKLSNFYSKIKDPVLANPVLKFEGKPHVSKLNPAVLPDLFRGEQLVVVGRYSESGKSGIVLEGTVNGRKQVFELNTTFPKKAAEHDFIPRLWASRRVGYLLDQIRLHGENKELKDEVTELARQYGIVTPYTAYLILEDEKQRNVPMSSQTLPQLQQDQIAREQIRYVGASYRADVSGDLAVNFARANSSIRSASSLAEASKGRQEAQMGLQLAPAPVSATPSAKPVRWEQQSQFVGGRNFYLNDGRWVDSQIQQHSNAKRIRLQYGSDDYFKFAKANAQARPWLAQGRNVEFLLNDVIYEVYE